MGVSLKKIFNDEGDDLAMNRSANAIKALIYLAGIVFVFLIVAIVIKMFHDQDAMRRKDIIQDMKIIQQNIQVYANKNKTNPQMYPLLGDDLSQGDPIVISTNGVEEEYRYGYYLLDAEKLALLTNAVDSPKVLNLPNETYIVNYDTNDVVSRSGVKFHRVRYYTIEDMLLIEAEQTPKVRQVIRSVADLEKIRANPSGVFKLSNNLNMNDYANPEGWEPIPNFSGVLDGRGYTIENLKIARPSTDYVGLFKQISGTGRVTNLNFTNVDIQGSAYVGTVAGTNNGTLSRINVSGGVVTGNTQYTGGLVGAHSNNKITNCTVVLDRINGSSDAGGLVGIVYSGTIEKSGATCNSIVGKEALGGAIGRVGVNDATYLEQIKAETTSLIASKDVGGLIGKIETSTSKKLILSNSYAKGAITSSHENGGGIVGSIICISDADFELNYLYADVDIVRIARTSGGVVGYTDINATSQPSVNYNFWEKDIAPGEELNSVGSVVTGTTSISFDYKDPSEMKIRNTYTDWDFVNVWMIKERVDSPSLIWEGKK